MQNPHFGAVANRPHTDVAAPHPQADPSDASDPLVRELSTATEALRREIMERRIAERQRGELLRRLVSVQEDERARIARALHDQIGQLLAAMLLSLKALEGELGPKSPLQKRLLLLQNLANDIGREIHDVAIELRPTALDDLGLHAALRHYVETWSSRTGIEVDLHVSGGEQRRLPHLIESAVYRVVQESLSNVARHAQATRVSVIVEQHTDLLSVIVEDNGRGFDVESTLRSPGAQERAGLLGMQERIEAIGGTWEFEAEPGQGATVYVRVPLIARPVLEEALQEPDKPSRREHHV